MALPVFQGVKLLASAYELLIDLGERKIAESLIDEGRAFRRDSCKVAFSATSDSRRPCSDLVDCQLGIAEQEARITQHWGDTIDPKEAAQSVLIGWYRWNSADLLRTYQLNVIHQDTEHESGPITRAIATRTSCKATTPPYSQQTPIACRNLRSDFPVAEDAARKIQKDTKLGNDPWRLGSQEAAGRRVLADAAKQWGVELAPNRKFVGCEKPMTVHGDQFSWCSWTDLNAMQELSVQVTRFGYLRGFRSWDTVPWIFTRGHGTACVVDN